MHAWQTLSGAVAELPAQDRNGRRKPAVSVCRLLVGDVGRGPQCDALAFHADVDAIGRLAAFQRVLDEVLLFQLRGEQPKARATWNAVCLADFGDGGVVFVAQPQIPPRNVNWAAKGAWVHLAKVGFEKYFLRKVRSGESEPFYERFLMRQLNIQKLKEPT